MFFIIKIRKTCSYIIFFILEVKNVHIFFKILELKKCPSIFCFYFKRQKNVHVYIFFYFRTQKVSIYKYFLILEVRKMSIYIYIFFIFRSQKNLHNLILDIRKNFFFKSYELVLTAMHGISFFYTKRFIWIYMTYWSRSLTIQGLSQAGKMIGTDCK